MKKFLLKFSIYFIILFLTVNAISLFSLLAHRRSSMFKPSFLVNNFNPADTYDYIILGGSTGLCTLNSNIIDSVCNSNGLNLSEDDTGAGSYLLMLQFFLSKGYNTKAVILTCDPGRVNGHSKGFSTNDYRMLPFINNDVVYDYFVQREQKGVPFRSLSKYIPMLSIAYYNQELFFSSVDAFLNKNKRHRFDSKGNFQYPKKSPFNGNSIQFTIDTLHFTNPDVLKIDSICASKEITLIYYLNPVYNMASTFFDSTRIIVNHRDLLKTDEYFYDRVHTIKNGAVLASNKFAEFMENSSVVQ